MQILIFGASGSIGNFLYEKFKLSHNVIGTTTKQEHDLYCYVTSDSKSNLLKYDNFDIIIWAHGSNMNDDIESFDILKFSAIIDSNVTFILSTLNFLLSNNKINKNAKMVIISSIWEEFTRDSKLSYSISKGCLANLTKSLSYSLAKSNILINNVLPGPIDNEMTRKTLNDEELEHIANFTDFKRLINLDDVYNLVKFLVFENTGVTGQSIKVDLGFTNIKKYK